MNPSSADVNVLPTVSVIVPTYNRAIQLPYVFDALARQVYPASKLELIVIDNSSTDGTPSLVEHWSKFMPFPVQFVQKDNEGPASSRNLGATMAKGEVLAFTDSDCVPGPCWVRNAARYLVSHPDVDVVCGPMLVHRVQNTGLLGTQHEQTTRDTGLYPSGNLVFRHETFDETGGFDETFGIYPWGALVRGEDTELVWRAKRRGARVQFVTDVWVEHLPPSAARLRTFLLQPLVVQIFPRLLRTIPELRQTFLWRGYFVSRDHALFYIGCASLLMGARSRQLRYLTGMFPWLFEIRSLLKAEWKRGGLGTVLGSVGLLAQHLLACALVLVVSSIRYRRLVL